MAETGKVLHLFVPGRLCLFGEHSDWAGMYRTVNSEIVMGQAVVTGIEQGIYATVERCDRFIVESRLPVYHDEYLEYLKEWNEENKIKRKPVRREWRDRTLEKRMEYQR